MVAAQNAKEITMAKSRKQTNRKPRAAKEPRAKRDPRTRAESKQAKLIEMLKRAQGATIDEIASEFEWQKHTVRGAIAGALKKKLGLDVKSEKVEGRGRVYRIAD
jgi:predicted HTH transcriptional regulator